MRKIQEMLSETHLHGLEDSSVVVAEAVATLLDE